MRLRKSWAVLVCKKPESQLKQKPPRKKPNKDPIISALKTINYNNDVSRAEQKAQWDRQEKWECWRFRIDVVAMIVAGITAGLLWKQQIDMGHQLDIMQGEMELSHLPEMTYSMSMLSNGKPYSGNVIPQDASVEVTFRNVGHAAAILYGARIGYYVGDHLRCDVKRNSKGEPISIPWQRNPDHWVNGAKSAPKILDDVSSHELLIAGDPPMAVTGDSGFPLPLSVRPGTL